MLGINISHISFQYRTSLSDAPSVIRNAIYLIIFGTPVIRNPSVRNSFSILFLFLFLCSICVITLLVSNVKR